MHRRRKEGGRCFGRRYVLRSVCSPEFARCFEHGVLVQYPRQALLRAWQCVEPRNDAVEGRLEVVSLVFGSRHFGSPVRLRGGGFELSHQPEEICLFIFDGVMPCLLPEILVHNTVASERNRAEG